MRYMLTSQALNYCSHRMKLMGQTHLSWPLPPAAGKRAGLKAFSHSLTTELKITIQNLITIIFIYKQSARLRGNHACFSNSPFLV